MRDRFPYAASYHVQDCLQESQECPTNTHSCGTRNYQITTHSNILIKQHIISVGHSTVELIGKDSVFNLKFMAQNWSWADNWRWKSPYKSLVPVVCWKARSGNEGGRAHKDKVMSCLIVAVQRLAKKNKNNKKQSVIATVTEFTCT